MVLVSVETLIAVGALAVSLGAALFWLGHLRADVTRLQSDVQAVQEDVRRLRVDVGILSRQDLPDEPPIETLKPREREGVPE